MRKILFGGLGAVLSALLGLLWAGRRPRGWAFGAALDTEFDRPWLHGVEPECAGCANCGHDTPAAAPEEAEPAAGTVAAVRACGDNGGRTKAGKPCGRRLSAGQERCAQHPA